MTKQERMDRNENILRLIAENKTRAEIAKILKCGTSTINRVVQKEKASSEKMVQSSEKMVQSPEKMVQSSEKMVQSSEKMVQSSEKMVQSPEKMVQSSEKMMTSSEKMVQSPEKMVQSSEKTDGIIRKLLTKIELALDAEELTAIDIRTLANAFDTVCKRNNIEMYGFDTNAKEAAFAAEEKKQLKEAERSQQETDPEKNVWEIAHYHPNMKKVLANLPRKELKESAV